MPYTYITHLGDICLLHPPLCPVQHSPKPNSLAPFPNGNFYLFLFCFCFYYVTSEFKHADRIGMDMKLSTEVNIAHQ